MIHVGGNGSWETIDHLLKDVRVPKMVKVRQKFQDPDPIDVREAILRQFAEKKVLAPIKPGDTVAITVGSRGISNQPLAVKTMVELILKAGGVPFLVPSMGSHAGATAEGQKAMLLGMGFDEESIGAPIHSSMETVFLGKTESGLDVLTDKLAFEADHLIIINRIKPHVCFRAAYESGIFKMITIGLGKQQGAEVAHNLGFGVFPTYIPEIALKALEQLKVLCAVGLVENGLHETAICEVMLKDEIATEEPKLLEIAKSYAPSLNIDQLDVLIIDEVGKNISGSGFDTNVVGRYHSAWLSGGPDITRLLILDITKESKGNGNGLGMADFTTVRAAEKFDFTQTYPNTLTATLTGGVKIPMVLPNDRQGIQSCIRTSNLADPENVTIARIRNTLCLSEMEVSANMIDRLKDDGRFEIISEPYDWDFNEQGNLF